MSRWGTKPNMGYAKLPLRKIVERWTEVWNFARPYPIAMITLECGHFDNDRGQKAKARCSQCKP